MDVYNLSHGYMKCNVDFEASHIVNRNAPMILFGFEAAVHNILDYKQDLPGLTTPFFMTMP